jgi:outer membrane beta-barrel protein
MESGYRAVFLSWRQTTWFHARWCLALSLLLAASSAVSNPLELEPMVVEEPTRPDVRVSELRRHDFEFAMHAGVLNVEDFGTDFMWVARIAYHISDRLFVEGAWGQSDLGTTSFETLGGGTRLLTDSERQLRIYNMSAGYTLLPGEAFWRGSNAWRGGLYVIGGAGSTEFAGDERFTWNLGLGYRLVLRDWITVRVDVRDHLFRSDLLGSSKTVHNFEWTAGLSLIF